MVYFNWQLFAEETQEGSGGDFDTLIKGEYKQAFEEKVQKILDGRLRSLRQENERLHQAQEAQEAADVERVAQLAAQAEEIRGVYPEFNWEQEMRDAGFARLIQSGVDGRTAYEVVHRQELLREAVRYGAMAAREQVSKSLQSGGHRVGENGARSVSVLKSDPRGLTPNQLADIRRRVQKGEKIRF